MNDFLSLCFGEGDMRAGLTRASGDGDLKKFNKILKMKE
jgi:hypothetical protein